MSSEMVSRVARAIDDALIQRVGFPSEQPSYTDYLDAARAAIESMREPSEAMLEAADSSLDMVPEKPEHFIPAWRAMIDAALKP